MATSNKTTKATKTCSVTDVASNTSEQMIDRRVNSSSSDLLNLLKHAKDGQNKRLEEDYAKLVNDYEALQMEHIKLVDLNIDYTRIINELTQLMAKQPGSRQAVHVPQRLDDNDNKIKLNEYEQQIKKNKEEIEKLQSEKDSLGCQLSAKEDELVLLRSNEKQIHEKLKLPENASIEKVEKAIEELLAQKCIDEDTRK